MTRYTVTRSLVPAPQGKETVEAEDLAVAGGALVFTNGGGDRRQVVRAFASGAWSEVAVDGGPTIADCAAKGEPHVPLDPRPPVRSTTPYATRAQVAELREALRDMERAFWGYMRDCENRAVLANKGRPCGRLGE